MLSYSEYQPKYLIQNCALCQEFMFVSLFYIRRLTGWRGSGERLAAVSTWILGNWFQSKIVASRGRVLGRNPDKSLKSFPPCYSQLPLQFRLQISISSNSHLLTVSRVQLLVLYTVKEKRGKPDRKPYPLPYD